MTLTYPTISSLIISSPEHKKEMFTESYAYRVDGVKIKKIHHFFSGKKQTDAFRTTEYIDVFQYKTETGIAGGTTGKDHLGNIRLSYFKNGEAAQKFLKKTTIILLG